MGKLRTEPKVKTLETNRFHEVAEVLREAQRFANDSHVFWDMEKGEDSAKTKKDFLYVAHKEGVGLKIRHPRKSATLQLIFSEPESKTRLSAGDARERILGVLSGADKPLKKGEILATTGISTSSWNMRIRELIAQKKVIREGNRRDTVYRIA